MTAGEGVGHTKTPWVSDGVRVMAGNMEDGMATVAQCYSGASPNSSPQANAAFIVKACNEYEALSKKAELAARMAEALEKHGQHDYDCRHYYPNHVTGSIDCNCGLAEALSSFREVGEGGNDAKG